MATPRDIRRLALLALYQLDSRAGEDTESIRASLDDLDGLTDEGLTFVDPHRDFTASDRDKGFATAMDAYTARATADAAMLELAPEWPAHRMPAVDRAILRLAHYEMHAGKPAKAVVNEAVELAKQFSTLESPGFVNALLDKILKALPPAATDVKTESA